MLTRLVLFWVFGFASIASAQETTPAVPAGSGAEGAASAPPVSAWANMVPLVLMFGVFYFLMIRPQQKKMKEQQAMISALKEGDQILTQSGMIGTVQGIQDKVVTVEIASNVKVKMLKSQVTQVLKGPIGEMA